MTEGDRTTPLRGVPAYAFAAIAVALAWLVRWPLGSVLGDRVPFLLFFPAVIAAAWFAGRNAGLLATALAAASCVWFFRSYEAFAAAGPRTWLMLGLFVAVSSLVVATVDGIRRTQRDLLRAIAVSRRAEEAERRLAAIVESSEDAIIAKDLSGRIVSWNRAAERLFGYGEEEALGKSIEILMPPDRADDWRQILLRVVNGERVEHFETTRKRKDGVIVNVSLTVSPVRDALGRIVGAAKIARDITAEKEAQRETERTREMFLGTLSHDLRNPLNTIRVSAHTLGRHASEADRAIIGRIDSSTERMARMIEQLLDFTKSRLGGGIQVRPDSANLAEICHSVADEFEATHPGRIRLSTPGDLRGKWDRDRLAEVIANLLSNALKYGAPDQPVTVSARGADDAVILEITNLGPPIPAALLPVIFDPFQRGPLEHRRKAGGLGLGLYIARQIVEAHRGRLDVRSSDAEGTTFSLTLPRDVASAA